MAPAPRDEGPTVAAIMTKPVVTATSETTVRTARRMLKITPNRTRGGEAL